MNTYKHPVSGEVIRGMRLAPGARVQKSDCYDSTTGKWEWCPCAGAPVPRGQHVIWVRPDATLSEEAKQLLVYMSGRDLFLTKTHYWKLIPTPRWRYDARMDWRIPHQHCAQELIDFGYVAPMLPVEIDYGTSYDSNAVFHEPKEDEIYRVTALGHELVKALVN